MTAYALRQGVTYCRIGESNVFLDIVSDRYFCLHRGLNTTFSEMVRLTKVDDASLAALRSSGILVEAVSNAMEACASPSPQAARTTSSPQRARALAVVQALWNRAIWGWRVRHRSLAENLDWIVRMRSRPSPTTQAPSVKLEALARAYEVAAMVWSEQGRCLPTSLALFTDLVRAGFHPRLVFAVHLAPFHAHCWVEHEGHLVTDDPERVSQFTPIRVV